MLRVVYSNRFERLAETLAAELGPGDVFSRPTIAVQSRVVAGYVELAIARRRGVAANLHLPQLDALLTAIAEESAPGCKVLDRAGWQVLLRSLLCDDELLAGPVMAPVRRYLDADDDPDARASRRLGLAGQLAALFCDYDLCRPELAARWIAGGEVGDAPEAWQRELYLRVAGGDGWQADGGDRYLPLFRLWERLGPGDLIAPDSVRLIGVSQLPRGRARALAKLARRCQVSAYVLNPCAEFWEDLRQLEDENPALALWGRPGRDLTAALQEITDGDHEPCFSDPGRATALSRLQSDVLARAPRRAQPSADVPAGDHSVRILACANPRRELEVIARHIWQHLERDATLRLSDVAVFVAPASWERYRAHVGAVFGELGELPFQVVDVPLAAESRLVQALDRLLDLPLGRFSRPELLGVVTHPAVVARYPDVDPGDWIRWTDRLGVAFGKDARDHEGTYLAGKHFHWDQGIRRLALGAFCSGERSDGTPRPVVLESGELLPEELGERELESAARFGLLCRSLIADAEYVATARKTLSEWSRTFELFATSYLTPVGPDDERVLGRCRHALASLAARDLDGATMGYREARELARAAVAGLREGGGEATSAGIVVAPLELGRPLPYRIVFAAGLGEGVFPAGDRVSALDVRGERRIAGEVSPRERDRHAFFELLLSARDCFTASYVARDEQSGEVLAPSSVVLELRELVAPHLAPADVESLEETHPLRRYHERYGGDDLDPIGARQAQAAALRRDLVAHCRRRGVAVPEARELFAALRQPRFGRVAELLGLVAPPPQVAAEREVVTISIARLRKFLEAPLSAWAEEIVGLRSGELDDRSTQRDEPFENPRLREVVLLRDVFLAHLRGAGELEAVYRDRVHIETLAGAAPVGVFGEHARRRHLEVLAHWSAELGARAGETPRPRTHAFGRAHAGQAVDELAPPIELGGGFELVGVAEPVVPGVGTLILVDKKKPQERHELRAMFNHAVLAAAGAAGDLPGAALLSPEGSDYPRFGAWSQDEARAYLGGLAAELCLKAHDYFLPCDPILKKSKRPLSERLDSLLAGDAPHSESFGPVDLSRVAPPADAEAIAERRFGPLLARREADRG